MLDTYLSCLSAITAHTVMTLTSPGLLFASGLAAVGVIALWGWKMADAPPVEVAGIAHKPMALKAPRTPAPRVAPPGSSSEPPASVPLKPEGPLARLFANPNQAFRLQADQLQAYLAINKRNAESLLAASRLTGEMAFLQEAARNFPADPAVQLELALRSKVPEERQRALESLRQADPDNALADHLSAFEHLRAGDPEAAFADLILAASKSRMDIYAPAALQSSEEAYLAADFTPVEAKAAAMLGFRFHEVDPLEELSKQLAELQTAYAADGDAASAEAVRQMGHALSQQVQSDAQFILHEVVGMGMEQSFLDPTTSAMREQEIQHRFDGLMSLTSHPKMRDLMLGGKRRRYQPLLRAPKALRGRSHPTLVDRAELRPARKAHGRRTRLNKLRFLDLPRKGVSALAESFPLPCGWCEAVKRSRSHFPETVVAFRSLFVVAVGWVTRL